MEFNGPLLFFFKVVGELPTIIFINIKEEEFTAMESYSLFRIVVFI
jgi:hypothetical protein